MSLAPFSMPRRSRRLSFSRSIRTLPGAGGSTRGAPVRIGRPPGRLTRSPGRGSAAAMLGAMRGRLGIAGAAGAAALWLALAAAPAARAEEPEGPGAAPEAEEPAQLDRLLTLPGGETYGVDRRGGLSRGEWRSRFVEIQGALDGERQALKDAEARMDEVAGNASNWQMAPVPGLEPSPDAPLDY